MLKFLFDMFFLADLYEKLMGPNKHHFKNDPVNTTLQAATNTDMYSAVGYSVMAFIVFIICIMFLFFMLMLLKK